MGPASKYFGVTNAAIAQWQFRPSLQSRRPSLQSRPVSRRIVRHGIRIALAIIPNPPDASTGSLANGIWERSRRSLQLSALNLIGRSNRSPCQISKSRTNVNNHRSRQDALEKMARRDASFYCCSHGSAEPSRLSWRPTQLFNTSSQTKPTASPPRDPRQLITTVSEHRSHCWTYCI